MPSKSKPSSKPAPKAKAPVKAPEIKVEPMNVPQDLAFCKEQFNVDKWQAENPDKIGGWFLQNETRVGHARSLGYADTGITNKEQVFMIKPREMKERENREESSRLSQVTNDMALEMQEKLKSGGFGSIDPFAGEKKSFSFPNNPLGKQ